MQAATGSDMPVFFNLKMEIIMNYGNHMVNDLYTHPDSPILEEPQREYYYACPNCYSDDSDEPGECAICGYKLIEKEK